MPRYARELCQSGIYHVMLRGNNKETAFADEEDKNRIVEIILSKKESGAFYVYSHCVMDNHLHLVLKEGKDQLSRVLKRVATSYAYYFNKKYNRIGHVFQDRYRSECIKDDRYLFSAIRYVHQNPQKAGISTMEQYTWSSYKAYIQGNAGFTELEEILDMISKDRYEAIKEFACFNHKIGEEVFVDIAQEKEINKGNLKSFIERYLQENKLTLGDLKYLGNKDAREELVRILFTKSDLSLRGISSVLGLNREMVRRVSKEPSPWHHEIVMAIPGVGEILGPRLIAEIGDVHRFHSASALVAYAGLDAPPFQSGNYTAADRSISKRGSASLRRTGYEVMR